VQIISLGGRCVSAKGVAAQRLTPFGMGQRVMLGIELKIDGIDERTSAVWTGLYEVERPKMAQSGRKMLTSSVLFASKA
jgi:hypothetical protein